MPGWNVGLVRQLRESLADLGAKGQSANRDRVVNCVGGWWRMPENAQARNQTVTAAEQRLEMMRLAVSFEDMRSHVIKKAQTSAAAWEALREYAHGKVVAGGCVEQDALEVLLRLEGAPKSGRGGRQGGAPDIFNRNNQLAAAVAVVIEQTDFKSLDTNATNVNRSAFAIVAEAVDPNRESLIAVIQKAWQKHKNLFIRENES